jgi:hypothetical protein
MGKGSRPKSTNSRQGSFRSTLGVFDCSVLTSVFASLRSSLDGHGVSPKFQVRLARRHAAQLSQERRILFI